MDMHQTGSKRAQVLPCGCLSGGVYNNFIPLSFLPRILFKRATCTFSSKTYGVGVGGGGKNRFSGHTPNKSLNNKSRILCGFLTSTYFKFLRKLHQTMKCLQPFLNDV